jgi:hypothetical protein
VGLQRSVHDLTGQEVLDLVRSEIGLAAVVEFERELCTHLHCARCDQTREHFTSLGRVTVAAATCPGCGELCEPELTHSLRGDEQYLTKTLAELGLPPYDIITGRQGLQMRHYLLANDRQEALGALA